VHTGPVNLGRRRDGLERLTTRGLVSGPASVRPLPSHREAVLTFGSNEALRRRLLNDDVSQAS
ncbi:hypothetical protein AB4144_59845, partial [Rhizobiaceae sp. 2RAB30]